jgi:hypothetical protein
LKVQMRFPPRVHPERRDRLWRIDTLQGSFDTQRG